MFASRSTYNRINKKVIAVCIAMTFLFNMALGDLAWANKEPNDILSGSSMGGGSGPGQLKSDLDSLQLPLSLGYVKKIYSVETKKPTVIYIQDAHCNYSCQKSIEGIIGYFNKNYGVNLAAVEGSAGDHDYSIFTSVPDIDLREKILNYFIREGRVTGVDSFASLNPDKLIVKGLEEPELYEKNLSVYRESLTFKDKVNKYLKILRHFIENLKSPIFSKKIKELDEKKTTYDDTKNKLKDYIIYLGEVSSRDNIRINKFQNLSKLLKLIKEEEKVNFKKAEKERETILELLTGKLSKIEIASLVEKSIEFKKGNMSAPDFYEYFVRKANSCNIDISSYPNLLKYKTYLDKYDNVEKDVFFEEIFDAERYIADNLFKADDERKLFYLSDDLSILNKLFSVSLTRRLYDYYHQKKDELKTSKFIRFIKEKASWYNMSASINPEVEKLDVYRDKVGSFYQYSFERDKVFIKNLNKYSRDKKAIFMVTGGFHTENMIDLLEKNGYSYVLITPKLMSQKDNPYFHLLAGSLSPIESILNEYTAALALKNPFSEMGEAEVREYIERATRRLAEFIPLAEDGWIFGIPYQLQYEPDIFMTLSLRSESQIRELLTEEELADLVEVRPAGKLADDLPLFVIIHRSKDLFKDYYGERREISVERAEAIRVTKEEEILKRQAEGAEVREAAEVIRPALDYYYGPAITLEAKAPLASLAARLKRLISKKYDSDTVIRRYLMGGSKADYQKDFEIILRGMLKRKDESPYAMITTTNDKEYSWAEEVLARFLEQPGLPEDFERRVNIVKLQIPFGHHINEALHVVWAKNTHNLLRFQAEEYGEVEESYMNKLGRVNLMLLKTIISNPDNIPSDPADFILFLNNQILRGLTPIRSLGVAETVEQMRENYEAIIRSL